MWYNFACKNFNSGVLCAENLNSRRIMTEQEVMQGLSYLTLMSYNRIDKSDLGDEQKRDMLYSLYCFRCVFDDEELKRASQILIKYGVSFVFKDKPEGDGVIEITDGDKKRTNSTFIRRRLRLPSKKA